MKTKISTPSPNDTGEGILMHLDAALRLLSAASKGLSPAQAASLEACKEDLQFIILRIAEMFSGAGSWPVTRAYLHSLGITIPDALDEQMIRWHILIDRHPE